MSEEWSVDAVVMGDIPHMSSLEHRSDTYVEEVALASLFPITDTFESAATELPCNHQKILFQAFQERSALLDVNSESAL